MAEITSHKPNLQAVRDDLIRLAGYLQEPRPMPEDDLTGARRLLLNASANLAPVLDAELEIARRAAQAVFTLTTPAQLPKHQQKGSTA